MHFVLESRRILHFLLLEYDLGVGDIDKIRVTPTVEVSAMVRLGVKVGFKGG